jgi:hypothetical protein
MTDRELLELAAKAAGIELADVDELGGLLANTREDGPRCGTWNPLTDDGDALRLAVKLRMVVDWGFHPQEHVDAWIDPQGHDSAKEFLADDPDAATRRAIVRAAAEMAK